MSKKAVRKTKKPEREYSSYCIEIFDWEMPYSFSVNRSKNITSGPYWEHACLKVSGIFLFPDKVSGKEIEISLLGNREMVVALNEPNKHNDFEPKCVCGLTVRGEQRDGLGSLPADVLPQIANFLIARKYKYLILSGYALYRGRAEIHSIHFADKFDKEEW